MKQIFFMSLISILFLSRPSFSEVGTTYQPEDVNIPGGGSKPIKPTLEAKAAVEQGKVTVLGYQVNADPTNDCCGQMKWDGKLFDNTNPSMEDAIKKGDVKSGQE